MLRIAGGSLIMAATVATALAAAPAPYSARLKPLQPTGPVTKPGNISLDPSLLDTHMSFQFATAPRDTYQLPKPTAPNAQQIVLADCIGNHGIIALDDLPGRHALHLEGHNYPLPCFVHFRSDMFDLTKRRAVTLRWEGQFHPAVARIEIRLFFGNHREIGRVFFHKGHIIVGTDAGEKAIGTYVGDKVVPGSSQYAPSRHTVSIRADLVKRAYTIRFEQYGKVVESDPLPFPAATGAIPPGARQMTAELTWPVNDGPQWYDFVRIVLAGELL